MIIPTVQIGWSGNRLTAGFGIAINGNEIAVQVAETTLVTNLNADLLDGQHGSYYAPASRALVNGAGITGCGDLTANRTIGLTGQALALHNLDTNGLVARTAAATVAARTITGTADQIVVTNGNGVSGNPVISLPALLRGINNINLDDTPDADDTFQGLTMSGVAGEALTQWQLVYCRDVSGANKWFKYDNTNATYKENVPMGMVVASAALNAAITVLLFGIVRNDGWGQAAADKGKKVYASTAGAITLTRPATSGHIVVIEGRVLAQNTIFLSPSMDYAEVVA